MTVFVSYSSRDRDAVKSLTQDLQDADEQVWLDQRLAGGDAWWRAILEQIRGCEVFIFALSQNSIESKPCQAELHYAQALGLPILPVQVGSVDSMQLNPLATVQAIDYRHQTPNTGMRLSAALHRDRARRQPLPSPLPKEPEVPFEYLIRLYTTISNPDYLTPRDQAALVAQLQVGLGEDGQHEAARKDIVMLLTKLHDREDATHRTRTDVEAILASIGAEPPRQLPMATDTVTPVEEQVGDITPPVSTGPPTETGHKPANKDRTTLDRPTGTDLRSEHESSAPAGWQPPTMAAEVDPALAAATQQRSHGRYPDQARPQAAAQPWAPKRPPAAAAPAAAPAISVGRLTCVLCGVVLVALSTAGLLLPNYDSAIFHGASTMYALYGLFAFGTIPGIVLLVLGRGRAHPERTMWGCALVSLGLTSGLIFDYWRMHFLAGNNGALIFAIPGLLLILVPMFLRRPSRAIARGCLLYGAAIVTLAVIELVLAFFYFRQTTRHCRSAPQSAWYFWWPVPSSGGWHIKAAIARPVRHHGSTDSGVGQPRPFDPVASRADGLAADTSGDVDVAQLVHHDRSAVHRPQRSRRCGGQQYLHPLRRRRQQPGAGTASAVARLQRPAAMSTSPNQTRVLALQRPNQHGGCSRFIVACMTELIMGAGDDVLAEPGHAERH